MKETDRTMVVQLSTEELRNIIREEVAAALANGKQPEPSRLLTPEEAVQIMGVTKAWLYQHSKHLPFVRRLSRKRIRFDESGLRRWLAARK